jgi:hypothetical protein
MPKKLQRYWLLQIVPAAGQAVEVEGLRVRLRVRRNGRSLDTAALDVWGIDPTTYGQITSPTTQTRLIAGYQDIHGELLRGTVVPLSLRRVVEAGEVITSWQIQEAATALRLTRLASAWPGPVRASEVLRYVASALGLSPPREQLPRDPSYARGYTATGGARDVLDTLAGDCGCRWSVQSGRLVLLPLAGPARVRASLYEPPELIGYPEQVDDGRVRACLLLEAGLLPGDSYRLGGDTLAGDYVAEIVEHTGDTHDVPWYTYVTGRPR